jgi:predicted phosphodiesterase
MKLAVLADIHANFIALEAVANDLDAWQPDAVVVAGDTINRGPRSRECWDFVNQRRADGWQILLGNHEEYVINVARDPSPRPGIDGAVRESVIWTWQQFGDVTPLTDLPFSTSVYAPDGSEVRIAHASMRGTRDNILVDTPDEQLKQQVQGSETERPCPTIFCIGHTHLPFLRTLDTTLVLNVGSVGLPFDGDRRASYARLVWNETGWQAQIQRLTYDWAAAERDFHTTGFLHQAGLAADLIFEELCTGRSRLFRWITTFEEQVKSGTCSVADSIVQYRALLASEAQTEV